MISLLAARRTKYQSPFVACMTSNWRLSLPFAITDATPFWADASFV